MPTTTRDGGTSATISMACTSKGGGAAAPEAPSSGSTSPVVAVWARRSRSARSSFERASVRYRTVVRDSDPPAESRCSSASPKTRATSGSWMSTDCSRSNGTRRDFFQRMPLSTRASLSSITNVVKRHDK